MQACRNDTAVSGPNTVVLATLTVIPYNLSKDLGLSWDKLTFEDQPPPSPWWNPLEWPLPCGISIDPKSIASWFSLWSHHEYESRSESGALYAERIASSPEKGIEHIDFTNLLSDLGDFANDQMASALRSTVLDARFLCIGSVQLPESVSLCLLPFEISEEARLIKIDSPSLPISLRQPRSTAVRKPEDIPLSRPTIRELHERISQVRHSSTSLILCFTISNPLLMGKSLDEP